MNRLKKLAVKSAILWLVLLVPWITAGCSGTEVGNPESKNPLTIAELETFGNEAELERYLKDQYARSVTVETDQYLAVDDPSDGLIDNPSDDENHSGTNIQEQGVDESDVIKTDGAYIYVADNEAFHIVDISQQHMAVVATQLVPGAIKALYLYNDLLVLLYTPASADGESWRDMPLPPENAMFGLPYWIPVGVKHALAVYDISSPAQPRKLKDVQFDGQLISSRRIDGRLHIVQQFLPSLPLLQIRYDGSQNDLESAVSANRALMAALSLNDLIPSYRPADDPAAGPLPTVSARRLYHPISKDGGGTITTVVTFDLDDPALPFTSVGMVADAHIVYASPTSLYIASQTYHYGTENTEQVTIYKYDLTGDTVRCLGTGRVRGWILNRYSIGEHQGILRVATTTGHAWGWGSESANHVYCLQLQEHKLEIIGRLENLAPGEQIYAARFMGERGFLVTYVRIDPLFTLDLSDPFAPQVAGELKVPGYSAYIHPIDENHLITIGKDAELVEADDTAWYQGVQLSIFNISDFSDPVRTSYTIIGARGTSSEALYNPKAFTFWAEHNLLAVPIKRYEHLTPQEYPWVSGTFTFEGLYVYRVSTDPTAGGFDLLGRIGTDMDTHDGLNSHWTRGVFVDRQIFAVTDEAMRSADIDDIETTVETLAYPTR